MTLTLNEKEKRTIATLIQERSEEHLSRFPYNRYPIEPLEEWKRIFYAPKAVSADTLKQALRWHFGGWQRKDLTSTHKKTIIAIIKAWPQFPDIVTNDTTQSFRFWEQNLPDWQNGFNAAAFLLHLLRPDTFELADQHRLQAMTELLKEINHQDSDQTFTRSLQELVRYTTFFRAILQKIPGVDSRTRLDRFLKAFGNRHAYKNVKETYLTKEPSIRNFSWSDCASQRFDLKKITLRSNADVLFACLLLSIEKQESYSERLTIGQVAEHIPLGTAGICNPASFNYAMIALFGNQKGRDYFQLESPALREAFTEQANQSTRDMKFYLKHSSEQLTINLKYINEKG
ncbi:hypothetical protein [Paenibacillus qinlingensis]|uniref:hypothetical protein n=1 Tax=Paenibacillus qinlingensis TaxID=1837343 RepID=UPI00156399B5|nr:hypothetical protein [Paenibacillus qinlingensis]NQX63753.1 hypothetical protein [Paenibacillus qinlingensis]